MSGVYIKGMKMPRKKNGAVLIVYPDGRCAFENGKEYKAVPIPPHGRLIDADALFKAFQRSGWYNNADRDEVADAIVLDAPTVIPEEGEK